MQSPTNNSKSSPEHKQQLVAGLYARVSTSKQEDEQTIDVQLAEIKDRIKSDGHSLSSENVFLDPGFTGTLLARPGLDNMRLAAAEGKFQLLYVYDLGRLARRYHFQAIVIEELEDLGIQFVSLNDKNAENEGDKVLRGVQGLFAEWERNKIAERFRIGKLRRAEEGRLVNGKLPYGYNRIKRTKKRPAYGVVNEEAAYVIRLIYKWFTKEQVGLLEIIRRLHKQQIKSPKGNDSWCKESIRRLLLNEAYSKGFVYYNKSESIISKNPTSKLKYKKVKKTSRTMRDKSDWYSLSVPTIIDDDGSYEKAAELLEKNKRYARKNRKHEYLLSGLAWCECGNKRVGDGYKNNHYYRCAERIYKFPLDHECTSSGVNAEALDKVFWKNFTNYISDPISLKEAAKRAIQKHTASDVNSDEKLRLTRLIADTDEELRRYAKAYGSGSLDFEEFKQLADDTKSRKRGYEKLKKEAVASQESTKIKPEHADKLYKHAKAVLKEKALANPRKLIADIVSKVIIKGNKEVEVWIKVPLPVNMGLYAKGRDRLSTTPTFELLPFVLIAPLPSPRKARIIVERDELGRIIHSKPPAAKINSVAS